MFEPMSLPDTNYHNNTMNHHLSFMSSCQGLVPYTASPKTRLSRAKLKTLLQNAARANGPQGSMDLDEEFEAWDAVVSIVQIKSTPQTPDNQQLHNYEFKKPTIYVFAFFLLTCRGALVGWRFWALCGWQR